MTHLVTRDNLVVASGSTILATAPLGACAFPVCPQHLFCQNNRLLSLLINLVTLNMGLGANRSTGPTQPSFPNADSNCAAILEVWFPSTHSGFSVGEEGSWQGKGVRREEVPGKSLFLRHWPLRRSHGGHINKERFGIANPPLLASSVKSWEQDGSAGSHKLNDLGLTPSELSSDLHTQVRAVSEPTHIHT